MSARHRVFLGVAIPDEVRHRLAAQLEPLVRRRKIPGARVPIENWHFTLRFVGAATVPEQERMLARLDESDLGGPFDIEVAGFGAFPKPQKAAVVWLAVRTGAERLATLAGACEDTVVAAGHPSEDRPFHAHLTLSRVRPPADVVGLVDLVESPEVRAKMTVAEVTLFRSVAQHGKPSRYEVVDTVPL